jgi:dolichyl-phosphate beta-glucosyltransferase
MKLSIVIPAFNEEKRLPATLAEMALFLETFPHEAEVIIVDDGSTDQTRAVAEKATTKFKNFKILSFYPNHGKGYAVKQGILSSEGDLILFMDADNATPLSEITKLLPYSADHEVIIGSRRLKTSRVIIKQPWYRIAISTSGHHLIQLLLLREIRDTQCGFKLFQRKASQELCTRQQIMGFGFDMELLAIARHSLQYKIKEVALSWYDAPGSHIRPIRDSWRILKELIKIRKNLKKGIYT